MSTKVGDFINEVIQEIHEATDFMFLKTTDTLTTVASQQEYTISTAIATDVNKILSVTSRDPERFLDQLDKRDIQRFDPDFTDEATDPFAYYLEGADTLGLYPTPSAVKTLYVDYLKTVADLTADADMPVIPVRYTQVIIDGAIARGLKWLRPGNPEIWGPQFNIYKGSIREMMGAANKQPNLKLKFKSASQSPSPLARPRLPEWGS
jgi:hypothetical protein